MLRILGIDRLRNVCEAVACYSRDWHDAVDELKRCDVIIGAVDSFRQRDPLERFARRYLIPYIDIGRDLHELGKLKAAMEGRAKYCSRAAFDKYCGRIKH